MAGPARSAMRYYGGKWLLAPWIISHFPPQHRIYVEPFGGAASVLLRKSRSYAEIYNDLDGKIVNVFRVLRDPSLSYKLERLIRLTPFARVEFERAYESSDDPVEQARRTIYRSFSGFGSGGAIGESTGFRNNSTRSGTTPATDWRTYPEQLSLLTERLQGVIIENRPAADVMRQHDGPETLHYLDPPYPEHTRGKEGTTRHHYRHEMTMEDHRDLARIARSLRGYVVISGYPCRLYDRELFADWHRVEREALADGARPRTEVLWLSPRTEKALGLHEQLSFYGAYDDLSHLRPGR